MGTPRWLVHKLRSRSPRPISVLDSGLVSEIARAGGQAALNELIDRYEDDKGYDLISGARKLIEELAD